MTSVKAKARGISLLFMTSLIWGTAFVAQRVGMDYVKPFTFNCVRSFLAGFALLLYVWITAKTGKTRTWPKLSKDTLIGGIACGVVLFFASTCQQIGLSSTTAGKGGFITALYIVIVPVIGLFMKKKAPRLIWFSVAMAVLGLYLLSIKEGLHMSKGDFWILLCSFCFSAHIIVIDYFSVKADCAVMSCVQFFVAGLLSLPCMFLFEQPRMDYILQAWVPIVYAGIMSGGVAYTLQIFGQKDTEPSVASLIMSLESVFAALSGWLLLSETLLPKELLGCALVFAAVILAQLPDRRKNAATAAKGQAGAALSRPDRV